MRSSILVLVLASTLARAGEPVAAAGLAAADASQAQPDGGVPPATPETTVVGARDVTENAPVGSYQQPKWTDRRRFPGVRLYVAPAGAATFEVWGEVKVDSAGSPARLRTMYELSFGLGYRFQVDLYLRTQSDGADVMRIESERLELRWALADWGVIPGNPTLYLEYLRQTEGAHRLEGKLLLGGNVSPRLFWGVNLFFESELWGADEAHEYGVVAGLAWSVIDSVLSLGAETRLELVDTRATRFQPIELEWLIGPSLSWRPIPQAHLLFTAYLGPGFSRAAASDPYTGRFVFQPTLVGGWRF
ncbi:MAG: hypothetical protein U0228_15855 [Myxococcaceae bacterium]